MKHHTIKAAFAALFTIHCSIFTTSAQTLHVVQGNVTDQYTAAQTGDMTYTDNGSTLTIGSKQYKTSDITKIYTTNEEAIADNAVSISYAGNSAQVIIAGNIAQHVTASVSGAHVSITQGEGIGDDTGKVEYTLSGESSDGEFYLSGSYKMDMTLAGLTLTNPNGPAIYIDNGKKINISVKKDTENTLADGTGGDWKGCVRIKGHTELKGKGTLNITGNSVNAFWGKEFLEMKNLTLNILGAVKDGINVNQHFTMESGTLNISNVGDDGLQVSYETDDNDQIIPLTEEEENTGALSITGGTINISNTAVGSKGMKTEGALTISETSADVPTLITISTTGGTDTSDSSDLKASACIKGDASVSISGGNMTFTNSGQGGRAINTDGTLDISGGTIVAQAKGSNYGSSSGGRMGGWGGNSSSSSNHKYAKGVKADGSITISGGDITISSASHEGLESKSTIDITGGKVSVTASDDAINAASHLTISGGYVMGYSTGNDGIDSNGNTYIKGGTVYAICSGQPEVAIDANTEGGYKLYVTGGTIVAIGGLENGANLTQTCYQASSWSRNTWYALTVGNETFAFKTPQSGGSGIVVSGASAPTLLSGVTVSNGTEIFGGMGNTGCTVSGGSNVSLSSYSGGNGMGGGGNRPGGGR